MQVTIDSSTLVAFVALAVAAASYIHLIQRDLAEERRRVRAVSTADVNPPAARHDYDLINKSNSPSNTMRPLGKRPANLYQGARQALEETAEER